MMGTKIYMIFFSYMGDFQNAKLRFVPQLVLQFRNRALRFKSSHLRYRSGAVGFPLQSLSQKHGATSSSCWPSGTKMKELKSRLLSNSRQGKKVQKSKLEDVPCGEITQPFEKFNVYSDKKKPSFAAHTKHRKARFS